VKKSSTCHYYLPTMEDLYERRRCEGRRRGWGGARGRGGAGRASTLGEAGRRACHACPHHHTTQPPTSLSPV